MMIKKENLTLCFLGIILLILPMIAYPKLIASNPTEFPTLNKFYKMESNLKSSKNGVSTETINVLSPLELEELLKNASSEITKAGFILSSPFGGLAVKIDEWISKAWRSNLTKEKTI